MSPAQRDYIIFLDDMLESMYRIVEYIGNKDLIEFKQNRMLVDAVVRNFEVIGEAAKNIPEDVRLKYPEIPWKKMYSLRNLISHEYFGIDYEMLWEIANTDLPKNAEALSGIIDSEKNPGV